MKPKARVQATIEILERIERQGRIPMDKVVGEYMRGRRYIGSKDRANIAERVYNIMRAHARLGWWLERAGISDTPRGHVIAYMILCEEANEKRLANLFDGSRYAPEALGNSEQASAQKLYRHALEHKDMSDTIRIECPPLYEGKLRSHFGDAFEEELRAMIPGAALDLRVNTFLATREQVREELAAAGIKTEFTPYSPWGLRAHGKPYLAKTKPFVKGWVEIQDEGSQLIARMCDAQPGMQVLDYCAGGGGKTLALAAAMQRKGRIVAMDTDKKRLEKGRERYKKAKLSDIIEVRLLSEDRQRKWLRRQKEKFDVVLCDVPCTGTGIWRRNPDLRWREYGPALKDLLPVQAEILENASRAVKPGGRLVYATCSLLPDENEEQIELFLKKHPEFKAVSLSVTLNGNEESGNSSPDPSVTALLQDDSGKYMRLSPRRHGTDGFFAAAVRRLEKDERP